MGEKEYQELKDKEDIQSNSWPFFVRSFLSFSKDAGSSFGKILFKKPGKKNTEPEDSQAATSQDKKRTEIDLIFNLDEKGEEKPEEEEEKEEEAKEQEVIKKKYLEDEQEEIKAGLQPPTKKRFIDGPTTKVTNTSASKVLSRESKAGNKKLLSFYDEEQDEFEEYAREDFKHKQEREEKLQEDSD